MSRIGKKPITIPTGVTVRSDKGVVVVTGPKGELTRTLHNEVTVDVKDNMVTVDVKDKTEKATLALWGTFAAHIKNMIAGVTTGFQKKLEVNGVGYRVALQGTDIKLDVGFSHPVMFNLPKGIKATVEKNVITLDGFDKELIGSVASQIRNIRKPEPYKGKGIKYLDETIRRKAGKTAKTA